MAHAIRFAKTGGPEVLEWQEVEVGKPGHGQVRLRHTAVGLNFIDTYQRSGLYPMPLPSGLGSEAAGVIEEVGPGVADLKPGDRVAYAGGPLGAYSEAQGHAGRPARQTARRHHRPAGRGDDAEGHDGVVPDPPHPRGQTRRDDPDPCRGGRGRADRLPMGQASRRHRDRHGRRRRKGGARQGQWLRPPDQLPARGFCRARQRDHRQARNCRSSTTRSARTRSTNRSTVSRRSG